MSETIKPQVEIISAAEAQRAGFGPEVEFEEGDLVWSEPGEDLSWMEEKRFDGTYRWCRANKRTDPGTFCKQPAMVGRNRCRIHGGATPTGIASPNFKHGKYSRAIPAKMLASYEKFEVDEEITALNSEIAILRSRLEALLELSEIGNSAEAWKGAKEATKALLRARKYGDRPAEDAALDKLAEYMLEESDHLAWKEIIFVIGELRKLTDSEQKRLIAMQQMVTANEMMTLVNALIESVRENVKEKEQVRAVLTSFQRLFRGIAPGES